MGGSPISFWLMMLVVLIPTIVFFVLIAKLIIALIKWLNKH